MKVIEKWFGVIVIVLVGLQIVVSPPLKLLDMTTIEKIEMKQRMDDYPSKLARVAHILEERPESRLVQKLERNFFTIFDIDGIWGIVMWVTMAGIFGLIWDKHYKLLMLGTVMPLIVLTIFGSNRVWGNFCLYPLMGLSWYGLVKKI